MAMSSYIVKPQEASPPSQPENVKTVGHEVYQNNTPFSDQDGSVLAGARTTAHSDRTARLKNRLKVLVAHSELKLSPSSPLGQKGSSPSSRPAELSSHLGQKGYLPSSRPAELSKSSFINARIDKERKRQKEFSALQAQVATLTGTLDSLMQMLKHATLDSIANPKLAGTPLPKFKVESPRVSPGVTFKDVLTRSLSPSKSSSSSAVSSPSVGTANSSPKVSPVAKHDHAKTLSTPARVIPATAEKGSATPSPSTPSAPAACRQREYSNSFCFRFS